MDDDTEATVTKNTSVDFRLVCRTCLAADAEFYKLDAPIISDEDEEKISMFECLRYCTQLENVLQFPIYICTECSTALQVAYNFIRNAIDAHEILRQELCPLQKQQQQRSNGLHNHMGGEKINQASALTSTVVGTLCAGSSSVERVMRYRCKICNDKLETKQLLKEHVKLHSDIITYCCQLCNFECKKRSRLSDHYTIMHGVHPTQEQLKYKTSTSGNKLNNMQGTNMSLETQVASMASTVANTTTTTISTATIGKNFRDYAFEMQQIHDNGNMSYELLEQQQQQQKSQQSAQTILKQTPQTTQLQFDNLSNELPTTSHTISNIDGISNDFPDFSNDFNIANEITVGNEFIVMADGTVEEVMGNGVVIEYINAAEDSASKANLENGSVIDNIVQLQEPSDETLLNMDLDINDIIIEESLGSEINEATNIVATQSKNTTTQESALPNTRRIKCKICAQNFISQEILKTHMLTHNEIPHFFCDQCKFYTFFKIDLTQHYKTKHNLQPTHKQLQPKNKVTEECSKDIFTCDMCLFETSLKANLRRHYLSKHQIEATEVQLRPAMVADNDNINMSTNENIRIVKHDYPNGLNCKKCNKVFYWRNKLKEHYKRHNQLDDLAGMRTLNRNSQVSAPNSRLQQAAPNMSSSITTTAAMPLIQQELSMANNTIALTMPTNTLTTAGSFTIPADAIPQIVETDSNIDNNIDFDFNGDALFEDFDEDDDEDDENAEHEECHDIVLTSEDDFEDLLEEQNNSSNITNETSHPFCVHCHKTFISQYQFENHMFVHRGLAPYRCEMCTNLYNTKRALIRHYKAVHKKLPTRDMIQAKGDKVSFDRLPIEHLHLEQQKAITMMCAKCPYESTEMQNLLIHLSTSHGVTDERYILQKLPFECPRCIRSFTNKAYLIRHLERSHSVATIIQQHSGDSAATGAGVACTLTLASSSESCGITEQNANTTLTRAAATIKTTQPDVQDALVEVPNATATYAPFHSFADSVVKTTKIPFESTKIATTTSTAILDDAAAAVASITQSEMLTTATDLADEYPSSPTPTTTTLTIDNDNNCSYQCVACEYTCETMEDLNEHSKIHPSLDSRDNFNFQCAICDCKYKTIELLKYHLKRHIARNYHCPECPKTYINKSELNNHRLLHTGEMPHKCDMCNKQFRYSHHLKRHKDVAHYGKRHQCPFIGCGRTFTTQAQLKIHAWNHNGNIPYKCKYCDRDFKKRESLRQHATKVHNVSLTEEEIAEIYRNTVGYTNPHDFTVKVSNGQMLRRSEVETIIQMPDFLNEDNDSNDDDNDDDINDIIV